MTMQSHKVFIGIDCLLDTRLAALGIYSEDAASELLKSGKYHSRKHNKFSVYLDTIDDAAVNAIFDSRNMEVLKQARVTNLITLLIGLVERYVTMETQIKEVIGVEIIINTYPYDIDSNVKEALVETVGEITQAVAVECVSMRPEEMSPTFLSNYATVIWHDFDSWVKIHHQKFTPGVMISTSMYCPEIYVKEDDYLEKIPGRYPSRELKLILSEHVQLELLPIESFSVYKPE